MSESTCSELGCDHKRETRAYCHKHYEYKRQHGLIPPLPCKGCGKDIPKGSRRRTYCSDGCRKVCTVSGCKDHNHARGWCAFHYTRWKLAGDPSTPLTKQSYYPGQLCAFDGCENKARHDALCSTHYSQSRLGKELREIVPHSKSLICAFCGGPSGILSGFRRVCSSKCNRMIQKHGGPLPETFTCIICTDSFPFIQEGRRRKKFNTKMCDPCRLASAKHGYSAKQLAKRDGTDCKLCAAPVDMTLGHPNLMRGSVDHIIPTSLGGSNEPENVQLAHLHCNIKKNNRVKVFMTT